MELTRREFVMLGLLGAGALLTGCTTTGSQATSGTPQDWPDLLGRPNGNGAGARGKPVAAGTAASGALGTGHEGTGATPTYQNIGSLKAIARAHWAEAAPLMSKILPMNGIERITVHHEGWTPVYYDDYATTLKRMDQIRRSHLERLGAGDIGYHFVIDRAGRLWQGRDLAYQGAHVHDHNPHNVGVMCLGNFDLQRPTDAQLTTLKPTLAALMKQFRVANKNVFTHQELNPTECPGRALQANMVSLRKAGIA